MFYTIVGTQWGDEGKGKIVDWLSSKADYVARFQGGNNAGHTIKVDKNDFSGVYNAVPERDQLDSDINENLIVELYSK